MQEEPVEAARNLFIRRWGEMAASWGISRTMAEIHALLYMATEPLCTDDIMEQLAVSRGSASMNLRELVNWGLIRRTHRRGDRKEYFDAERDVWQMFETITRERRRREVEPILETIDRCRNTIDREKAGLKGEDFQQARIYEERFDEMVRFFELMNKVFNLMTRVGPTGLKRMAGVLEKLVK